jgi:predicted alpha/beta hydrolase family esterase
LRRVIVVPRWSGRPDSDWYPWLRARLLPDTAETPRGYDPVLTPPMPEPGVPRPETWVPAVRALLGDDPAELARTVVIGHSVGWQAALRALATLPGSQAVLATLCVAGWWDVDAPWETLKPWIDTPFDEGRARAAAGQLTVILSDNDQYTSDYEGNAAEWQRRLGATVVIVPGAAHFNADTAPVVLDRLNGLALERPD